MSNNIELQQIHIPLSPDKKEFWEALERDMQIIKPFVFDVLSQLAPREERIVKMRTGLSGKPPMAFKDIGTDFGVTGQRIRQIYWRAMDRLRTRLEIKITDFAAKISICFSPDGCLFELAKEFQKELLE